MFLDVCVCAMCVSCVLRVCLRLREASRERLEMIMWVSCDAIGPREGTGQEGRGWRDRTMGAVGRRRCPAALVDDLSNELINCPLTPSVALSLAPLSTPCILTPPSHQIRSSAPYTVNAALLTTRIAAALFVACSEAAMAPEPNIRS